MDDETRAMVAEIRRVTRNGQLMSDVCVRIAEDEEAPHAARIAAAKLLWDRGYGQATQHIAMAVQAIPAADYSALTDDELEQMERLHLKAHRAIGLDR